MRESAVGWAAVHFVEEVADGQRRDSAAARRERQPALQAGARRVLQRRESGRCGQCRRRQQQKQHGGGAIEAPSPLRVSAQVGRETHQRGNQREVAQQEQRSKLRPPVARRENGHLAQQRSLALADAWSNAAEVIRDLREVMVGKGLTSYSPATSTMPTPQSRHARVAITCHAHSDRGERALPRSTSVRTSRFLRSSACCRLCIDSDV